MKALFPALLSLALLTGSCSKCKCDEPSPTEFITDTGLTGNWKLINRQCYCSPTALPNEQAAFTATTFAFYKDGTVVNNGTYAATTGPWCGGTTPIPLLRFTYANNGWGPANRAVTVSGDTLVIDSGGCLDAPVDTYRRVR